MVLPICMLLMPCRRLNGRRMGPKHVRIGLHMWCYGG